MVKIDHHEYLTEEEKRLKEDREREKYWKKWGPYVAERQWATGEDSGFYSKIEVLIQLQCARITVQTVMRGVVSCPK
jgi:hypothetical protein